MKTVQIKCIWVLTTGVVADSTYNMECEQPKQYNLRFLIRLVIQLPQSPYITQLNSSSRGNKNII